MSFMQDFKSIGIKRRGFQLKLEKEAKKLCSIKIKVKVPVSEIAINLLLLCTISRLMVVSRAAK